MPTRQEKETRSEKEWERYYRERFLDKVKKKITRPAREQKVRRRDWLPEDPDASGNPEPTERIVPRGEQARRQAALDQAIAAAEAGSAGEAGATETEPEQAGWVVEVNAGLARVDVAGQILLCKLGSAVLGRKTNATPVAVGDRVSVTDAGDGRGVVEAVHPRRAVLARPDVHNPHFQQVVVANVDLLLIVASWREPALWLELIDRYLITARRNDLAPIITVSKIDLAEDAGAARATVRPYVDLGLPVVFTSTVTGEGLAELANLLRGRVTVLAGLSGAGKSSLINAIQPGLNIRAGQVSADGAGRHTTTGSRLWTLDIGGAVIDTPGVREWGLAGLRRSDLAAYYPEIETARQGCRFRDCLHVAEPGCAVRDAMEAGRIAEQRYTSYLKVLQALPALHE